MKPRIALTLLAASFLSLPLLGQSRMASDFEIAQVMQQMAASRDFLSQLSGHLNLGDLYLSRSETSHARSQYRQALDVAAGQSLAARRASDITRYATATAYAALAAAKLGESSLAFTHAEESIRYTSGSAKTWNLYATVMTLLRKPVKATSAARNAVSIATTEASRTPTPANRLDLAVYKYSLASSLIESGGPAEAEELLREVTALLRSRDFAGLRGEVARAESFEIYSSARGDRAAYLSLVNRAGLRLAALLEGRGDNAAARREYEAVLAGRSDDPTALTALARLSEPAQQERYFAAAFDANPFSLPLIQAYRRHLRNGGVAISDGSSPGVRVRRALMEMQRDQMHAARMTLDALIREFPGNDALAALRAEAAGRRDAPLFLNAGPGVVAPTSEELGQLLSLLQSDQLTPSQREALDGLTFRSTIALTAARSVDGRTILGGGTIGDIRYRFSEPTIFAGNFATQATLTYRILGATEAGGSDALLLEPVRLEP